MKTSFLSGLAGVLAGAAIVGGAVWAVDRNDDGGGTNAPAVSNDRPSGDDTASPDTADGAAAALSNDFSGIFEQVRPSIVRITTGEDPENVFDSQREGLGSGIVIDDAGHILTNYHVVSGFDEVTVAFADGAIAPADVVGEDPGNDIALVKVDPEGLGLKPAALGDSDAMSVGAVVAAIGNPFGLDGTFTTGVISGLDRTLPSSADGRPIRGLLQTDTAVNPGNSGGALINLQGEIIGINTAIVNPGGSGFAGVAYAVPINTPKRFMTQLVDGETIEHPRMGISGRAVTAAQAEDLGIEYGVAVLAVDNGSGADEAGLRSSQSGDADVIIAIDGQAMRTFQDLADYIDSREVGDEVTLQVRRDGETIDVQVTLQSWDSSA